MVVNPSLTIVLYHRELAAMCLFGHKPDSSISSFTQHEGNATGRGQTAMTGCMLCLTHPPPSRLCVLCTLPRRRWLPMETVDILFDPLRAGCSMRHDVRIHLPPGFTKASEMQGPGVAHTVLPFNFSRTSAPVVSPVLLAAQRLIRPCPRALPLLARGTPPALLLPPACIHRT